MFCCINWSSKQQVRQHLSLAYHREEICVRSYDFKCVFLVSLWSFLASVTRPGSCCCFEKMCFWQQQGEPETDSSLRDYNRVAGLLLEHDKWLIRQDSCAISCLYITCFTLSYLYLNELCSAQTLLLRLLFVLCVCATIIFNKSLS